MNRSRLGADGAGPAPYRRVSAVLGLAVAVMLVAACGGGGLTGPPPVEPILGPPSSTLSLPSGTTPVTSAYLTSCEQQGSTASFCQCTLSWLEQNVSDPQFMRDVTALHQYAEGQTSKLPPDVVKAYAECLSSS